MQKRLAETLALTIVFSLLVFLSLNRDSKVSSFTYQSAIWSDKAGYHVYLPAAFEYGFYQNGFPENIVEMTGSGFSFTTEEKLNTKYTCGVALLQLPFYAIARLFGTQPGEFPGYTKACQTAVNLAGVSYLFFGALLLFNALKRRWNSGTLWWSISLLIFSSNLFYFGIIEAGMSHVYSFFVFAALLYQLEKNQNHWASDILTGMLIGLLILIRPINILAIPILLLMTQPSFQAMPARLWRMGTNPRILLTALVTLLPQLVYWHFVSGNYFHYGYGNEGFSNFPSPPLFKFLFSPHNGLFPYAPVLIFILAGIVIRFRRLEFFSRTVPFIFIVLCFTFASWWNWHYGCSYGCRPFSEFMVIFTIPACNLIYNMNARVKIGFAVISAVLIAFNLKMIYSGDNCWYYGDWDWNSYLGTLRGPIR
ncbi:MAG: hypothetical protein JNM00_00095 [Flavobacteriales bacterium]|nr:hypothetical protein [Flavobacteriales bacterium]